jgi:hypothetical protein
VLFLIWLSGGEAFSQARRIERSDLEIIEHPLTSTLVFQAKPRTGRNTSVTYTIKAEKDGLKNIVVHLEAGRLYTPAKSGIGADRVDIEVAGVARGQIQTYTLPGLNKGQIYSRSFTVKIPNVDLKALEKLYPDPDRPIVAAWTTFQQSDGKPGLDCKIGKLSGASDEDGISLEKGNYFASLYMDTDETPSESNSYFHYFGPTDGPHGDDIDWIRNLEQIRKALDLPNDMESRGSCVHLWGYVKDRAAEEKRSQDEIIARLAVKINGIAREEKITKLKAAKKFLHDYQISLPKTSKVNK